MSVGGVSKSSIARVQRIGWNTVDRWLEKASASKVGSNPDDRYGWIQVLSAGSKASVWFGVFVRTGDQEATERPCGQGGTQGENGSHLALGGILENVGGLEEAEHFVHRAIEPDDTARLGILAPQNSQPRSAS